MNKSYRERKNDVKISKDFGLSVIILGIILGILTLIFTLNLLFAFSVISSFLMLGIALFAVGISMDSDIKMDVNSNENFLIIIDEFENKRIDMFQDIHYKKDYSKVTTTCWKCRTYTERALSLYGMANISPDNQSKFYQHIEKLMEMSDLPFAPKRVLLKGQRNRYKSVYVGFSKPDIINLRLICENCLKFNELNGDQKGKLLKYIKSMSFLEKKFGNAL